ncbi:MAG: hypothetical protein ACMG55_15775 [Microcoleus sp.]
MNTASSLRVDSKVRFLGGFSGKLDRVINSTDTGQLRMNNTAKNLVSPLTYINIARSTTVVLLTTLFIAEGKRKKEESRRKKKEGQEPLQQEEKIKIQ